MIVSQDTEVKNKIIKATNRQTPVKTEELTALTDFQKLLEDYYDAISGDGRLFYERRSQQYRSATSIEKIRIVNISNQIRSFSSMFLGLPHQASRYYGTLLKSIETKIFVSTHPPLAYYVSALALYKFEYYVRRKMIDTKYRPFKYHLLGIFRMGVAGLEMPSMTANKFERYCGQIKTILDDDASCLSAFKDAISLLDSIMQGDYSRDRAKDASLIVEAEVILKNSRKSP